MYSLNNSEVDNFKCHFAFTFVLVVMLGLLWGVSGALEMRDLDSDGSGAQLWLACIVGPFRVWLTSILACRLNRRKRGLGHSGLLKWVPFGTLIANVSATCVMAAFATLMKVEGFTALIEMMVSKFGRDGASFTRGRAATKKVECRALSSSACVQASRVFPELSITYSNKNLSFGIVDLGLFPNTAEKFGISLGSNDRLPTYILFENGVEITRFPELDFEAKTSTSTITKKLLCSHFELDRHLIDYINSK